jgi:YVTN family beta-propeller protein
MRSVMAAVGGLVVLAAVTGCNQANGPARSSGSLGVSNDSQYLYAADTDNGSLFVLDSRSLGKVAEVKVGVRPFRVAVGHDDTIYVANRGSRSVSVISHGDWSVVGEIATGVDPVGMQVSVDGKTLYVVSATASDASEYGILQAIDTATRSEKWNLPVGEEPRGLALVSDDRALISLYKQGDLVQVDLKNVQVIDAAGGNSIGSRAYTAINQSALTSTSASPYAPPGTTSTFKPRAMSDLAVTPDGKRVFATALLSRESPILTQPTPATPYYAAQGPRLAGSVTTPAVITLDTSSVAVKPLVEDVGGGSTYGYGYPYGGQAQDTQDVGYPQTSYAVSGVSYGGSTPVSPVLQGPSVVVVDMTGRWLFMVNRDSSNVAIISTDKHQAKPQQQDNSSGINYSSFSINELPSVHSTASIGQGADGIAILGDNTNAYVYNQFDHTVQRLTMSNSSLASDAPVKVATDVLPEDQVLGRKLFHDANDRRISAIAASVACSSCHLEGRDDGHVWQFPDGPRQTPTLAGRGVAQTAPYHWSGEFPDLQAFLTHTITSRMGGTGLPPADETRINAFVDNMPAPENPYRGAALTDAQQRGAAIFQSAQCGTCHSGEWLTNNTFANVGTLTTNVSDSTYDDQGLVVTKGLNVPSLRGLARSAPYLHNGKAATLRDRLMNNPGDQHGRTSNLTPSQIDDLVAFLRTL